MVTNKKRLERIKRVEIIGDGRECPKCKELMERRKHREVPHDKAYYYSEWDYCRKCKHVQHYEQFKVWGRNQTAQYLQREEEERNLFKNL